MNLLSLFKNLKLYSFVAVAIISIVHHKILAQTWTQKSKGIYGGNITAITAKGNFLFAGTYDGGIFRSSDKGITWTAVNNGITLKEITSFVVKSDSIFAGSYFNNVYLSVNDGNTWQQFSSSGLGNQQITSLFLFNKKLFAGTVDGIYVTSNFTSWTSASSGLPAGNSPYVHTFINTISGFGTTLVAGTFYNGAFLSKDNGATWIAATGIPTSANVSSVFQNNNLIYIGSNAGIYVSTDNGNSWSAIGTGLPQNYYINSITSIGSSLFATTSLGLYQSVDNGSTWNSQSVGQMTSPDGLNVVFTNGSDIYLGAEISGIYHSIDGTNWDSRSVGITALKINSLAIQKKYLFATTSNGLYRSADNADTWTFLGHFDGGIVTKGDSLIATSFGLPRFSTDYGANWFNFSSLGLSSNAYLNLKYVYKGNIFADSQNGLIRFSNLSNAWTPAVSSNDVFSSMASVRDTLFAATWLAGVYISNDDGITWTNKSTGLPNFSIMSITNDSNKVLAAMDPGIYSTSVNPIVWNRDDTGTSTTFQYLFATSGNILAGDFAEGAYWSPDKGLSWTSATSDYLSNVGFLSFTSTDSSVFAGTTEGVWTTLVSDFLPKISSFSPTSGVAGTNVTITGKNFSASRSSNSVSINGVSANVVIAAFNTLIVTVPPGATTGPIEITINGKDVISANKFCVAASLPTISLSTSSTNVPTLTSSSNTSNQWLFNGVPISGATGQTYNPTMWGNYAVVVSSGDCQFQSLDFYYTVTGLETTISTLQAYPIPFANELYVSLSDFDKGSTVSVRLINVLGTEIGNWSGTGGSVLTIPTSGFGSGLYVLTTIQDSKRYSLRVLKH